MAASNTDLPALDPASLRRRACDALRSAIVEGRLRPGDRLKEVELAEQLGISRAPVREALCQLEHEGLVASLPYRATEVLGISQEEIVEVLVPLRVTLESFAFRKAMPLLTEADLQTLALVVWRMREAGERGDLDALAEDDVRFHELVIERSGQPHCLQIWRSIEPRVRACFRRDVPVHPRPDEIADEHEELLQALGAGDEALLVETLTRHIRQYFVSGRGQAAPALAPVARDRVARRWWEDMVLYECHLPSLRDGSGDGIGDLQGLIDSLDYLAGTLGVTALWTGPFYRSPLLDQGFDISDHCDVEPIFGDLETVDRLVVEAHARDLKVIIDYVPNHTSDQHPWFVESRSSRTSPKRDWYVWADAAPGRDLPNNWVSETGGSVWEWDQTTQQFYLHSHLREQPDLNWRNPEVRAAMRDVLRFWLDRGVDGFRIDVAHMLMKDPELRDNPPNPSGATNPWDLQHAEFSSQLHVNDRMHPDLHGVLREIRALVDSYDGDCVTIGEIEAMDWERWARYLGAELDELHLPFAFKLIETAWHAGDLRETIEGLESALPEGGWPIFALGNHDRPRLASRLGAAQARVAAMLLLTLRGTPTLLYADELGMLDQDVPRERQRDHFGLAAGGVSRDPTRTPMPWNDGPNGGYAPADAPELWLPIWEHHRTHNVEAQLRDPASMLSLHRQLIELRGRSAALRAGDYATHPASDARCLVYVRATEDERKLVALNLTGDPLRITLGERGHVALTTGLDRIGEPIADELHLGPDEGVIVELERSSTH